MNTSSTLPQAAIDFSLLQLLSEKYQVCDQVTGVKIFRSFSKPYLNHLFLASGVVASSMNIFLRCRLENLPPFPTLSSPILKPSVFPMIAVGILRVFNKEFLFKATILVPSSSRLDFGLGKSGSASTDINLSFRPQTTTFCCLLNTLW